MFSLAPLSRSSRGRFAGVGAAWWLTRWALVLLLAFDQFSSPLHAHEHDGAAGLAAFAAEHDRLDTNETHAQDGSHTQPSHALMAARSEPPRWDQASEAAAADSHMALVSAVAVLGVAKSAVSPGRPRGRSPPDTGAYCCMPPASRAPPLHA
ncbi:MAG: hypothetical protein Q8R33_01635 [Burkholderiales bacterium]|nr:hypothetical protein [Burkholderiales bacterium]